MVYSLTAKVYALPLYLQFDLQLNRRLRGEKSPFLVYDLAAIDINRVAELTPNAWRRKNLPVEIGRRR
jgi:hypothetical protein